MFFFRFMFVSFCTSTHVHLGQIMHQFIVAWDETAKWFGLASATVMTTFNPYYTEAWCQSWIYFVVYVRWPWSFCDCTLGKLVCSDMFQSC